MERFQPPTRAWFSCNFDAPTEVQRRAWEVIASGLRALLAAPTGSGKTLAASEGDAVGSVIQKAQTA